MDFNWKFAKICENFDQNRSQCLDCTVVFGGTVRDVAIPETYHTGNVVRICVNKNGGTIDNY